MTPIFINKQVFLESRRSSSRMLGTPRCIRCWPRRIPHTPPGGSFRGSVTISFNLAKWPARAKSQGRDAWSIRGPGKGMGFSCKSTRLDLSVENRMSAVST